MVHGLRTAPVTVLATLAHGPGTVELVFAMAPVPPTPSCCTPPTLLGSPSNNRAATATSIDAQHPLTLIAPGGRDVMTLSAPLSDVTPIKPPRVGFHVD